MALTWTRVQIREKLRELVAMPDTSDPTDAVLNDKINDFYQNKFPDDVHIQELETFFEINTSSVDDGEYILSDSMHTIEEPMTIKDSNNKVSKIGFYQDKNKFFTLYPEDAHDEKSERNKPQAALLYGRVVYLRPKANAVFTFKTAAKKKPAALSLDTNFPLDVRWGDAIAYGTAVMIEEDKRSFDIADKLSRVYVVLISKINGRDMIQMTKNQRAIPRF